MSGSISNIFRKNDISNSHQNLAANLFIVAIVGSSFIRFFFSMHFPGFYTGDDVEILEASFWRVFDLHYTPWAIRNLLFSDLVTSPCIWLAKLACVHSVNTLVIIAHLPMNLAAAINAILIYNIARKWTGSQQTGYWAGIIYTFHPLVWLFGSMVYPRIVTTMLLLVAMNLVQNFKHKIWVHFCAGLIVSLIFAFRYSEIIYLFIIVIILLRNIDRLFFRDTVMLFLGLLSGIFLTNGSWEFFTRGEAFYSLKNFFTYTLLEKQSSSQIVHQPVLYYFKSWTDWLPKSCVPFFIIALFNRKSWKPILFVLYGVIVLSFIHHKESRYLQAIIPFVSIWAAIGIEKMMKFNRFIQICTMILIVISAFYGMKRGIHFLNRKSNSAVYLAMDIHRNSRIKEVALSLPWTFGDRIYLGNEIQIRNLSSPPTMEELNRNLPDVEAVGLFYRDIRDNPEILDKLNQFNFIKAKNYEFSGSLETVAYYHIAISDRMD